MQIGHDVHILTRVWRSTPSVRVESTREQESFEGRGYAFISMAKQRWSIDKSRRELQIRVSLSFYVCDRGHPFAISQLIWIINRQAYCIPSTYLPRREKPRQNVSDKWYIAPIRKQNVFFLILINIRVLLGSLSALHFSLFQIYKEYFCIFGVL